MKTAQEQAKFNKETAITQFGLNAVDQYTPFGNLSYEQIGTWDDGTPRYRATQTLDAAEQDALNRNREFGKITSQIGIDQAKRIADLLGTPINMDGVSPMPNGEIPELQSRVQAPVDLSGLNMEGVEARLTDLGRRRLDPMIAQRQQALESQLINQGVQPGTEAWQRAKLEQGQVDNDAYNQLFLTGNQQAFGQGMDIANQRFRNNDQQFGQMTALDQLNLARQAQGWNQDFTAHNQSFRDKLQLRNQPINEITALMSGNQVSMPNYVNTPQSNVGGVDYGGMVNNAYMGQMDAYKTQQAGQNAMWGALGSLGGAALGGWGMGGFKMPGGVKGFG